MNLHSVAHSLQHATYYFRLNTNIVVYEWEVLALLLVYHS